MKSGIYRILNKIDGKFYIGSASYFADRKANHLKFLRRNNHSNAHLQRAYNKYSEEAFEFQILECCEKEKLIEREQYWIDSTKACKLGYNMLPLAKSVLGIKRSEETKKKISRANKGRKLSEEHKAKLRGKTRSPEHRLAVSCSMKRRKGKKYGPRKYNLILNGNKIELLR